MYIINFLKGKLFLRHLIFAFAAFLVIIWLIFLFLRIYTHHGQAILVPDFRGKSVDEVRELCEENGLQFQAIDSVYSTSYPKGTVVDQNPPTDFKVKENRTIFLTLNACIPEKVKMPNVVGISLRYAKAILESNGLKVGRLRFVIDLAVNNVMEQRFNMQEIAEGGLIIKGSKIDLVLGKGYGNRKTVVPKLKGLEESEAKSSIIIASLNTGAAFYDNTVKIYEDSLMARVWKQYPEFNGTQSVNLGSSVDIWLTIDSSKYMEPDTTALTLDLNEEIE